MPDRGKTAGTARERLCLPYMPTIPNFGMRLDFSPNQKHNPRRPASLERGAYRPIVTTRGARDAVDVLAARTVQFVRTNGADADAKARGPGLPTLRPSRVVTSRAATGAKEPGSRGERAISVKTVAQGMPDDPAEPVVPAASFSYCWRATGEAVARHSLRPLLMWRAVRSTARTPFAPRERELIPSVV
jgi:hypothetical protein